MSFETPLLEGDWDFARALNLSLLAEASYTQKHDLEFTLSEDMGLELVDIMPDGSSQGFVAKGDNLVVLAFAGTNQLTDWLTNLTFRKKDTPLGEVHKGFFEAYMAIQQQTKAAAALARQENSAFWITGHSLGGALALIAAHDLHEDGDRTGLATFGQPRAINPPSGTAPLTTRLPLGYHRIVNGNDVVTRVPPNLKHAGELVTLGRRRRLFGSEDVGDETGDLEPMSEDEFTELQETLRAVQERAGPSKQGAFGAEAVDRSVEGMIPGIKDHKVTAYVAALRALVPSTDDDDTFEAILTPQPTRPTQPSPGVAGGIFNAGRPSDAGGRRRGGATLGTEAVTGASTPPDDIPVLIRLTDESWTPPAAVKILSRTGTFVTAKASAAEIQEIERDQKVKSVEISRPGGFVELADSMAFVKGQPINRPDIDETGANALVGIIDTGIDIMHDAFLDADGKSRIVAIWDQLDNDGKTPHEVDGAFPFDFGTLHTNADIEAMRAGTKERPDWMRDPQGHGTHVAGIAAGRKTDNMAAGMAPDAGIIVVIPAMETMREDPVSLGYSVSHINALQFLKSIATADNTLVADFKPIAINVSLGMNAGAHDGQTLLEAAFDSITSQGGDPGVTIVKSAGNERQHRGHCHVDVAKGRVDVDWVSLDQKRSTDYFEAWFHKLDRLSFVLHSPDGGKSDVISRNSRVYDDVMNGNKVQMKLRPKHPDNGDSVLYIVLSPEAKAIRPGIWTLEVRGEHVSGDTTGLHIWAERTGPRAVEFSNASEKTTISIPGTANEIITVGGTDISPDYPGVIRASSFGPSRSNAPKPELSAPGKDIVSAWSNQSDTSAATAKTGTSMAAPHVTGALALAMSRRVSQNRRQFNTQQFRSALMESVQFGSGLHHHGFGYGILDVAAFLASCDEEL